MLELDTQNNKFKMFYHSKEYLLKLREADKVCPDCKGIDTIFNDDVSGTRVCKAWGTVQEMNVLDETSEWRNFEGGSESGVDKRRVGGPVNSNLENGGVTTAITGTTDAKLTMSNNRISANAKDKTKMKGWSMIKDLGREIHIGKSVLQEAMNLFSKVEENDNLAGKKMILKVASVIMIASRTSSLPKNMKQILKEADIKKKELSRCCRQIKREVCPHLDTALKPSKWIPHIANKLGINGDLEDKWKTVAEFITQNEFLDGRHPNTIAGVAVYFVTQLDNENKQDFKKIGKAAELADATIRNAFKKLFDLR